MCPKSAVDKYSQFVQQPVAKPGAGNSYNNIQKASVSFPRTMSPAMAPAIKPINKMYNMMKDFEFCFKLQKRRGIKKKLFKN
jgi:hypothetical protein